MDNNLVGKTIQGRYYVVKQLGRGGVGVTFLARDQQCFDSQCVVKQLKPKSANTKTLEIARRLFNREAEIMNRLGDYNFIPRLLAYFEHNNDFFLVQELIEGHDLSQEIITGEPWSEAKSITLLRDILEVLMFVQQNSVIHRDLKPSNLMRRIKDNKIVLIDFGSVKQVSTQTIDAIEQIKPTLAVGTKSYMPMEQLAGRPGFHSDIFAVGVIVIQALTGVHPQELMIDSAGEIIWRDRLNRKSHYQPKFLDILDKMIRRRHQERYSSAGIVLSDLVQLDIDQNNNKETILISNHHLKSTEPASIEFQKPTLVDPKAKIITPSNNLNHKFDQHASKLKQTKRKKNKFPKILPLVAGVLVLFVAIPGSWLLSSKDNSKKDVKLSLYENAEQKFKLDYPEAWLKKNRDDFFATGVDFFSPLESDSDKFQERVSILVENLSENTSLKQYTNESIAEIKRLSDSALRTAKTTKLGDKEAKRVVYTGNENGIPVKKMETWSVQNNQAYVVTYTAQTNSYEKYLPIVQKMLTSFVISN